MIDENKMPAFEKEVYSSAYNQPENIRASNAWCKTFTHYIEDAKKYSPLTMPVLGIGSNVSYHFMKMGLTFVATDCKVTGLPDSGHYMSEEKPEKVLDVILPFLNER